MAPRRSEFWYCNVCEAQNHQLDGECQYCSCEGAECKRDNCSGPCVSIRAGEQEGEILSGDPNLDRYQG